MKKTIILLTILFFLAGSAITAQNIIYVSPNGIGNGSSWATATGNLQAAINSAATQTPKPDIWVAAGIYYGDSIAENNAFTMADGVNVYGGFVGNEPANYDLSLRDFETNETVLDGQNVQRVLYQTADFTDTTTWDGFTIRNGNEHTNLFEGGGGACLKNKSVLNYCNLVNNSSIESGGGISVTGSLLTNCNISNNTASGTYSLGGGAIISNSKLINCNITKNACTYEYAGGAWINNTTLINCIIWGNMAGTISNQLEDFINTTSTVSFCAVEGGYSGEGNIYLAAENNGTSSFCPRFVNSSPIAGIDTITPNIDWHLQSGSICINRGNTTVVTDVTDLSGNIRIQHDTVDIGCFESSYYGIPLSNSSYTDGIIYVAQGADGNMDGTQWADAMSSIRDAIGIAATLNINKIFVAAGTYYGDSIGSNNAFTMAEGVDVYGGFAGNEPATYDLSLRNFETNETVLDGRQNCRVLNQPYNFSDTTIWDGFTIQNGIDGNGDVVKSGGAFLLENSFLRNCLITNNTGNGIYAGIHSTVTNCTISNNESRYEGGGIYADNSMILNCIIYNNHVEGGQSSYGGGIYAENSTVNGCDIYNNHSDFTGGGIVTDKAIVNHCRIYDNHSDVDGGGATFNDGIITNCEIHNNTATRYGGGVELYSVTLYNCNIYNNTNTGARPYGSGVYASTSSYSNNLPTQLINCNIVNNFASRTTGGIYCQTPDDTIHNIFTNCIVWGNRDNGSSEQIEIAGGVGDFSYCAVEGGWTGTNNVNLATANYGNNSALHYVNFHTPTGGAGADYDGGNWVFTHGSACIDTGTPDTTGLNLPATDLLDNNRIYNGRIDIGANEYFPGTSIADHSQNDLNTTLTLFPNPATNTVELQITNDKLQIIEIEVMDMMGKLVKTTHALNPQSATINVSVLAAGTYFVRVTTSDGNVVTKKLVKQ